MNQARVCVALTAAFAATQASAAFISYTLDQSNVNPALADGTAYAAVVIDDNTASTLTFTVTLLSNLSALAGTNFGVQEFGFNVLGTGNPLADAASSNSQWTLPSGWSASVAPPPNQLDGFGRFEVSVATNGGARLSPLVFQIKNTGLNLSSFSESSTGTAGQGNVFFAAHVAGFSLVDGGTTVTSGYFGGQAQPAAVPLPGSAGLLALALGGAGLYLRRQRRPNPR